MVKNGEKVIDFDNKNKLFLNNNGKTMNFYNSMPMS